VIIQHIHPIVPGMAVNEENKNENTSDMFVYFHDRKKLPEL